MGHSPKKPRVKLDPKKFIEEPAKKKKQEDWQGSDVFNEVLRSKLLGKHR